MATTVRFSIEVTVHPETSVAQLRAGAHQIEDLLEGMGWTECVDDPRVVVIPSRGVDE